MDGGEVKPTVSDVLPLVLKLYQTYDGGAGCCLHIVLDDGNVNDSSVDFCIKCAQDEGHPECEALARLLRQMSRTQRKKLASMH